MAMSNVNHSILTEIDWDEGLALPIANAENKKLENKVQKNQTRTVACKNELAETEDRISAMSEHLRNVRQELQHTQNLVNAREKELQTESHILKLIQREEGRLKQEVSCQMKGIDGLKEQTNDFENKIFKQTQRLEELKAQMNWDQQTLEAWLEESTRKDEDAMTIQKYTRQDEVKIKELTSRMEKLMAEAQKKKQQLHVEITTTTSAQIELDKIADDFRHAHIQREELLAQWETTIEQMQRRDREMNILASKLGDAKKDIRQNNEAIREKLQFLDHEKENNAELEKRISVDERLSAQLRMELLNAEQQKTLFQNEIETLKRTVDRTALDMELTRISISHIKKETAEKTIKLEEAKNLRQVLIEKIKEAAQVTLTAAEKATFMEEMLQAEEKKQETLRLQLKRLEDLLYRKEKELTDIRSEEKRAEASINAAHNTLKNQKNRIVRLDATALKQQEILYSQDFTLQQLERRSMHMQGLQHNENASNYEDTISVLKKELQNKNELQATLSSQVKRLHDDIRHVKIEMVRSEAVKKDLTGKMEELDLYNDNSDAELKSAILKKQQVMVEENLMKLKVKKIHDLLKAKGEDLLSMEKRKVQLNTAMKERQLEIKAHKEMLVAQIKVTDDERQQISAELHSRISKIDKMKKRYEILTVTMSPPEGDEEKSQAYYVIKAAQEKEELQREGDLLDARIRKAEKEILALENTLKLMNGRNEQYRKSFNNVTDSSEEIEEKHQLNEQFRAIMDKYKYKKRQIKELQDDLHTMSTTYENLAKDEAAYNAVIEEKKKTISQFNKEEEEQRNKLERVDTQNIRLSKSLRQERKVREELPEEKDFRVRELREFIKNTMTMVFNAAANNPEMFEVVQMYFTQANLPALSTSSGPGSFRSQGSSRGSTVSSTRSSASSTKSSSKVVPAKLSFFSGATSSNGSL